MTDIELKDDAEIVRENYNKNAEKECNVLRDSVLNLK